jgi:hypothetical protein
VAGEKEQQWFCGEPRTHVIFWSFNASPFVVEELQLPAFKQVRQAVRKSFNEAHQNNLPLNTMLQMVRDNAWNTSLVQF